MASLLAVGPDSCYGELSCARRALITKPNIAAGSRLFREFDPGLLHFAVRQKPDERFIVKIDNLDPVAPGITKIAAEIRLQS
jgi:hypothetical protein